MLCLVVVSFSSDENKFKGFILSKNPPTLSFIDDIPFNILSMLKLATISDIALNASYIALTTI